MFGPFKKTKEDITAPKLVFPEAAHASVLKAASLLYKRGKAVPILVGNQTEIREAAKAAKVSIEGMECIDPAANDRFEEYGNVLQSLNQKNMDLTQAKELMLEPIYYSLMALRNGEAQGMVVGVQLQAGDALKPAMRVFPESRTKLSSFTLLTRGNYTCMFGDCSFNANPEPDQLAMITQQTAESAKKLSINPKIALLSFSTKGSSKHPDATKVKEAYDVFIEENKELLVDGEIQFDVAVHPETQKRKHYDSPLKGEANVFIFPDLDAANIGLKIAQHFGGFEVLGPFAQGFPCPIGMLGEDAGPDEVYRVAQLTSLLVDDADTEPDDEDDASEEELSDEPVEEIDSAKEKKD